MNINLMYCAASLCVACLLFGCGAESKKKIPPKPDDKASAAESVGQTTAENGPSDYTVRFAAFNVAMNRENEGQLLEELNSGDSEQAKKIAEVIQRVRPDVLLINEFDYDAGGKGIKRFCETYLAKSQNGQAPIVYEHIYFSTVNTGYDSGMDLNNDGKTGGPNDAFGFGQFPGKYAMVVVSRYPIARDKVRTFQKFLWKDMPKNKWPIDPETNKPYYSDDVKEIFRLSSKSHWDVPIIVGDKTIHFITAHPTPPAFDGPEDRNGRRNYDEIRMIANYVGGNADYLYDDKGVKGGLEFADHFVVAGDMNADPVDGDGEGRAGRLLTQHPKLQVDSTPTSGGGAYYAREQGKANLAQKGDPSQDTSDFSDSRVGNLRVDYCLPSRTLVLKATGVFWPKPDEPGGDLADASDHHLVWIDIEK